MNLPGNHSFILDSDLQGRSHVISTHASILWRYFLLLSSPSGHSKNLKFLVIAHHFWDVISFGPLHLFPLPGKLFCQVS